MVVRLREDGNLTRDFGSMECGRGIGGDGCWVCIQMGYRIEHDPNRILHSNTNFGKP